MFKKNKYHVCANINKEIFKNNNNEFKNIIVIEGSTNR